MSEVLEGEVIRPDCRVYWGSHGCSLVRGHPGHHDCGCCECDDHDKDHREEGCVGKYPYYGDDTNFFGEDAPNHITSNR